MRHDYETKHMTFPVSQGLFISISQKRKLSHREAQALVQGHTAHRDEARMQTQICLATFSELFPTRHVGQWGTRW